MRSYFAAWVRASASFSSRSLSVSSMLPRTSSFNSILMIYSFSCTIFLDMDSAFLSVNLVVVTSFYQKVRTNPCPFLFAQSIVRYPAMAGRVEEPIYGHCSKRCCRKRSAVRLYDCTFERRVRSVGCFSLFGSQKGGFYG